MQTFKWESRPEPKYRHTLTEHNYPLQHALWVILNSSWGVVGTIKIGVYMKAGIDICGEDYEEI